MKRHAAFAFVGLIAALNSTLRAEDVDALALQGKESFGMQCSRCHGPSGKGDGPDAKRLTVVPRDLTEGVYKFQSTKQGTAPSDKDLLWILNHGMSGAGMPSFANLSM